MLGPQNMTIGDEQIQGSIPVVVERHAAEPQAFLAEGRHPGPVAVIFEQHSPQIVIEGVFVVVVVGQIEIGQTVPVEVREGNSHAGLILPIPGNGAARPPRRVEIRRGTVGTTAGKQEIGCHVIGDIQLGKSVFIEIGPGHGQTVSAITHEAKFGRTFFKTPRSIVDEEPVGLGVVISWAAIARFAAKGAALVRLPVDVHVIGDEEIQISIGIEVGKHRSGAPLGGPFAQRRCGVFKRSITQIPVQPVRTVAGDKEVREPVLVEVPHGCSLAIAIVPQPGHVAAVLKSVASDVAEEAMTVGLVGGIGIFKPGSIGQVEIGPAIEIKVEPGHSAAHDFGQEIAAGDSVGVEGVIELQFFRPVHKRGSGQFRFGTDRRLGGIGLLGGSRSGFPGCSHRRGRGRHLVGVGGTTAADPTREQQDGKRFRAWSRHRRPTAATTASPSDDPGPTQ